jgi:hypothetical protein
MIFGLTVKLHEIIKIIPTAYMEFIIILKIMMVMRYTIW